MELIQHRFLKFFKTFPASPPFLLALSGGPDSMALFYLLKESGLSFEVAHLNHGWREESDEEQRFLEKFCKEQKLLFHHKKVVPAEKNREEAGRNERHLFFRELMEKKEFQAVVLGHHADDLAETVLKRVFEGATLSRLKGPSSQVVLDGVTYLRPLLKSSKKEILAFLAVRKAPFFCDPTNNDDEFLRGRFRKELFPYLSKIFGKEIAPSLCRLSCYSAELHEFLEHFLEEYRHKVLVEKEMVSLDFTGAPFRTSFEWKAVIKDFFEKQGVTLSHPVLESMVEHLRRKRGEKEIRIGSKKVVIGREKVKLFV